MAVQDYTTGGGANKVTYNPVTTSYSDNPTNNLKAGTGMNNLQPIKFNDVNVASMNNDQLNNAIKFGAITPQQANTPTTTVS